MPLRPLRPVREIGVDEAGLRSASELLPWEVRDVSVRPFGDDWGSFNPSVHYDPDDRTWRCVIRCSNYSLKGGVPRMAAGARSGRTQTRNLLAVLDPDRLAPTRLAEIREADDLPRTASCGCAGLEDLRLFRTGRDGLCAVATALQYNLDHPGRPEVVLCRLGQQRSSAEISSVLPLRGDWSSRPQKNWVPFDGAESVRLLYSIERGVVMSEDGPLPDSPPPVPPRPARGGGFGPPAARVGSRGVEVKVIAATRADPSPGAARGRTAPAASRSEELRGGSQLVRLATGAWLGIAHEMATAGPRGRRRYWHTFYACDDDGRLVARSAPLKLSNRHDIEFAAGLAVDERGRVVISFGVDDDCALLGVTELGAVLSLLRPVEGRADARAPAPPVRAAPRRPAESEPDAETDVETELRRKLRHAYLAGAADPRRSPDEIARRADAYAAREAGRMSTNDRSGPCDPSLRPGAMTARDQEEWPLGALRSET
jgi:hypothetical protein